MSFQFGATVGPFITFIVPTLGRATLPGTLVSLQGQTDPSWEAVIIYDGQPFSQIIIPLRDTRFKYCFTGHSRVGNPGASGDVRNFGMFSRDCAGEWFGFVDDDDVLNKNYVAELKKSAGVFDVVIFRMRFPDGRVAPADITGEIFLGDVGISFAVRRNFVREHDIRFEQSWCEDFKFLRACLDKDARILMSPEIMYYVCPPDFA